MAPVARAIALTLAAGGVVGTAHAQRVFSPAWFANMGAIQNTVSQTGILPNGMPASSLTSPPGQQQRANDHLKRSINNLNLAARGIAVQQAAQEAARQAAQNDPSVPDGLGEGGLKVDTNSLTAGWLNAKDPTQTVAGGRTTVGIQQTADKAILNWETFNVGRNTTVNFDQATYDAAGNRTAQTSWAVLNQVNDPNARPSQIQGQIKADATVMIVNRNGVVFSGTSQVNTRNLVAAAANISKDQFENRGLHGASATAASFTDAGGAVSVERGALIQTSEPKSVTDGGGYVMLLGKEVTNVGEIVTRKGQTLLAAGDSFIIRKGAGTDANTFSTTRGSEIAPQFLADGVDGEGNPIPNPAGKVTNTGLILAREGDITLAGREVRQDGTAISTTTVHTRGTIHLLSPANAARSTVTLGENAVTAIVTEDDGQSTALDAQRDTLIKESAALDEQRVSAAEQGGVLNRFDNYATLADRRDLSRIEIVGGSAVDFETGSLTLATGGQLAVASGNSYAGTKNTALFRGDVRVNDGAVLDVSGSVGVNVAMESNNIKVNVQGNELRDAPLNRDTGKLFNKDLWLDRRNLVLVPAGTDGYESDRYYTAGGLLEVSGYLGLQGHSIGEWTAQGGQIHLASDNVVTQAGSLINLAGGTLDVATGYVNTSWLKGADGRIYSASNAPADVLYTGVYVGYELDHARWGVTESFYNPLIAPQRRLENGYTVGRDAGELLIWAPDAALAGEIDATVFNGVRQIGSRPSVVTDGYKLSQTQAALAGRLSVRTYDPTANNINPRLEWVPTVLLDAALPAEEDGHLVWLDLDRLNEAGLGGLSMVSRTDRATDLTLAGDLTLAPGGVLDLQANAIELHGSLTARGGSVRIKGAGVFNLEGITPGLTLKDGIVIDTRGLWVNTALEPDRAWALAFLNGGLIDINLNFSMDREIQAGDIVLETGSRIHASAGGAVLADGSTRGGAGGDIRLTGGNVVLDGELASYGFTQGGKLSLKTLGNISIGGTLLRKSGELGAGEEAALDLILREGVWIQAGNRAPSSFLGETYLIDAGLPLPATSANGALFQPGSYGAYNPDDPASWSNYIETQGELDLLSLYYSSGNAFSSFRFRAFDPADPAGTYGIYGNDGRGWTIPKGWLIESIINVPVGTILPVNVFPDGLRLPEGRPVNVVRPAGTILTEDRYFDAGSAIPKGWVLNQAVAVQPGLDLLNPTRFFQQGFSAYELTGVSGVIVQPGTRIDVTMPVQNFIGTNPTALVGDALIGAAERVLPKEYFAPDPANGVMKQRAGADVSLAGGTRYPLQGASLFSGALVVGQDAAITVDPGHRIDLTAKGQIIVDGTLSAPGGHIALINTRTQDDLYTDLLGSGKSPNSVEDIDPTDALSVWIGSNAVLDVAGRAYTALDPRGNPYGVVLDGGSVQLGGAGGAHLGASNYWGADSSLAYVVVRPGAQIDASGASAVLAVGEGSGRAQQEIASDGGDITISSLLGFHIDDGVNADGSRRPALRAEAGGSGASGGSLSLILESGVYAKGLSPVTPDSRAGRALTVAQHYVASDLADGLTAGSADAGLAIGQAHISVDQIEDGGFDSLSLWGRTAIVFDGDVDLSLGRSLTLQQGYFHNTTEGGNVRLSAPYVLFDGGTRLRRQRDIAGSSPTQQETGTALPAYAIGGSFTVDAGLIDLRNSVRVNYGQTTLNSAGDLRFLAATRPSPEASINDGTERITKLRTWGDLELAAAQVYPASEVLAAVTAGIGNVPGNGEPSLISIRATGEGTPAQPYSVFGHLSLNADVIRNGGVLRAPFGTLTLNAAQRVELLPGSITGVGTRNLAMPFGGTVDGVGYTANGVEALTADLISGEYGGVIQFGEPSFYGEVGLTFNTASLVAQAGSLLDLSGGGELLGAAFVTGRGGSADTLLHPRNPGGKVYAIVPGAQPGAAPVAGGYYAAWNGAVPEIGQQITIPEGVPGLPTGTYTLMPANYALLPGAWRVELGGHSNAFNGVLARTDGSYVVSGRQSLANTGIRDALDTHVTLTSGQVLRTYSSYNETGYGAFQLAEAQRLGTLRPLLEGDGKWLMLNARIAADSPANSALVFDGLADFSAAKDHLAGGFALVGPASAHLVIAGTDGNIQNDAGTITVAAAELEKLDAVNLVLGGRLRRTFSFVGGEPTPNAGINVTGFNANDKPTRDLTLESGVTLTGGQIVLGAANNITFEENVTLDTIGHGLTWLDQTSGLRFGATADALTGGSALLLVSNGLFAMNSPSGAAGSSIALRDGATLYSEGTVGFYADRGVSFSGAPNIGTRNLSLAVPSFNIGTEDALAAVGALPVGMNLNQTILDRLFAGNPAAGVPSIENLVLTASQSINFFGSVDLDTIDPATGKSRLSQLVFDSPAIYGYGGSDDLVRLTTDTLVWNNTGKVVVSQESGQAPIYESSAPGAPMAGGTGSGRFQVDANTVVLGNPTPSQPDLSTSFNRLMLGFADVELNAAERITGNAKGSISVYQTGADPSTGIHPDTYAGTGGNLHLNTPLLTGAPGSVIAYHAGGALNVVAPAGSTSPAATNDVGAQIDLHGGSIHIASAVVLPSGKLTLTADQDVTLAEDARLDVSGRQLHFFDATRDTWGGDIELSSLHGNIVQQAGSTIDVSAKNEDAGSLNVTALDAANGRVALDGTLRGHGAEGYDQGRFLLGAQRIGSSAETLSTDFAALNTTLTEAGFVGARAFAFKQGDLTIGNDVKAHEVTVSVDGGSVTVNGRIDATGAKLGTIRLAARDDLRLTGSAQLDAHGSELQVDSYGQAIEAKNRGTIELTSAQGWLRLDDGVTLDVSAPGVNYGRVTLNARRSSETGGDILVDASGRINVRGAKSIAVNGFWTYSPTDADGSIVQDNTADGVATGAVGLDQIDLQNQIFYTNALANSALQARLAGLKAHDDAYHLRPGVEIVSSEASGGKLTVKGDLNLASYRYGPQAVRNANAADYGAGEPLALTVRAAGDLDINGSITDGFGLAREAPDGMLPGEVIPPGATKDTDWWLQSNMTLLSDWTVPDTEFYQSFQGYIYDTNWNYYGPGMLIPAGTTLMGDGYSAVFQAGQPLPSYQGETIFNLPVRHWAVAPMLAAGSLSASVRLVGGADLAAADTRTLQAAGALVRKGNVTLDDFHQSSSGTPVFSVLRTGTGDLDILAGGDFAQKSLFGIYTAGMQSNLPTGNEAFNLPRAKLTGNAGYDAALNDQATWFPDHGGDLYVAAQGNLSAYQWSNYDWKSDNVASWLWRQGGDGMGQQTAWSVNFGTYVVTGTRFNPATFQDEPMISVVGFTGFGALGGGNLTLLAGGDAGRLSPVNLVTDAGNQEQANTALVAAIGATGRVTEVATTADGTVTGGTLVQTGGGDLTVRIGGHLDSARFGEFESTSAGSITNLRGDIHISAGAIGVVEPRYGQKDAQDPRGADLWTAGQAYLSPGFTVVPGDGTVNLRARGDLVLGGVGDATMLQEDPSPTFQSNYSRLGTLASDGGSGIGRSWFSLWTPQTEVSLFSLGGNVKPFSRGLNTNTLGEGNPISYLPANFMAVAGSGSLYYGGGTQSVMYELVPAPDGQLELLAQQSIYSMRSGYNFSSVSMSGARAGVNDLPNPFKPAWILTGPDFGDNFVNINIDGNLGGGLDTNTLLDITSGLEGYPATLKPRFHYFAFQSGDVPQTLLHAGDQEQMRVYAVDGDIVGMSLGSVTKVAKAAQVRAGRDIVRFDGAIMNANETDVSIIEAGRDVLFAKVRMAGPGTLEVNTGRNLYQGDAGQLVSVGAIIPGDTRPGAGIAVQVGSTDVDWAALASLYLNPANQADLTPGNPLAGQSGKVAHTYEEELAKWLSERYGVTGTTGETLAHFNALPAEQQHIFLRTVYYTELREGGREYNDVGGPRFGSYLRGRQVIATLFPTEDAVGDAIERSGTYTAFGASGIQTQFGGDIQMLVPAGQIILGVQGAVPPATSGLITQGRGDIQLYSEGSILLGLSRIMTTFGGSILAWSAQGDINAGRGSKTTLVYTPPKRAYDQWGNVTLSPQVPSSGAGIATLNPIPEVPPGDVDLIAPLGTIDAGEAGIRVSGNVNLAALHVVNAENIQVQGEATGIPMVAAVNVSALTNASAAASSAATAAQDAVQRERAAARQNLPSIFTVRVLGFGSEPLDRGEQAPPPKSGLQSGVLPYDLKNRVQVLGHGQDFKPELLSRLTAEQRRLLQQSR